MKLQNSYIVAILLIFVGAFSRLIDRLPNFSAMEALALFGGAYLASRVLAYIVPIISIYLSDLIINNTIARQFFPDHEGLVLFDTYMIYNIIAMLAIVAIGRVLLKKVSAPKVLGGALVASSVFFVITNIGSWLSMPIYTKDIAGLTACFTAARPFFNNSLISNLVFSIILFGSYELYKRYIAQKEMHLADNRFNNLYQNGTSKTEH